MLQMLLDHFFRHLPYRGTKLPSRPKMLTPVSFLMRGWLGVLAAFFLDKRIMLLSA